MKIRKIISLTALVSFAVLTLTSVILYIVPEGRVAFWSDWHLWGLTKSQWGNIHINVGVLFLSAIFFHIYYNWKQMLSYLKNQTRELKIFTGDFNAALILTLAVVIGTYSEIPPLIWITDFSDSVKGSAAKKYGEPPYGHAELSTLKNFTAQMGLDLTGSMEALKKEGLNFESESQTLREIANLNQTTPQQVYLAMKPKTKTGYRSLSLPDMPAPGFGRRSLADVCQEYQLNIPKMLRFFSEENIKAEADMTIKMIAEQNSISPTDVYAVIKNNAEKAAAD